jgi:hypothetical protein
LPPPVPELAIAHHFFLFQVNVKNGGQGAQNDILRNSGRPPPLPGPCRRGRCGNRRFYVMRLMKHSGLPAGDTVNFFYPGSPFSGTAAAIRASFLALHGSSFGAHRRPELSCFVQLETGEVRLLAVSLVKWTRSSLNQLPCTVRGTTTPPSYGLEASTQIGDGVVAVLFSILS